jgi:hypothetical protein
MLGVGDFGRRAGDLHDLRQLQTREPLQAKPSPSPWQTAVRTRRESPSSSHESSGIPQPLAAIVGRDRLKKRCGSRRRTMVEAWAAHQHWRKAGRQRRGAPITSHRGSSLAIRGPANHEERPRRNCSEPWGCGVGCGGWGAATAPRCQQSGPQNVPGIGGNFCGVQVKREGPDPEDAGIGGQRRSQLCPR